MSWLHVNTYLSVGTDDRARRWPINCHIQPHRPPEPSTNITTSQGCSNGSTCSATRQQVRSFGLLKSWWLLHVQGQPTAPLRVCSTVGVLSKDSLKKLSWII